LSGYLRALMAGFEPRSAAREALVEDRDVAARVFDVLTGREFCYLSKTKAAPYRAEIHSHVGRAAALAKPIPFYYDIGGGYHASVKPGIVDLGFQVGLAELFVLRQIVEFARRVQAFYAPGVKFFLVIDDLCALLVNQIPQASTSRYCRGLRELIRDLDLPELVELLVESEHVALAEFAPLLQAAPDAVAPLTSKQRANVERFLGRPCDDVEAAARVRRYREVIEASERLLTPLIHGVHMTQRATDATIAFRPFPGGDSRIQCGEVAVTRNHKGKLCPVLLTSSNVHEFATTRHEFAGLLPALIAHVTYAVRLAPSTRAPGPEPVTDAGVSPTTPIPGRPLRVALRLPRDGPTGARDNFFLGYWHPSRGVHVDCSGADAEACELRAGRNWFLAGAVARAGASAHSLVHVSADGAAAVAFRGYVLPQLHAYSASPAILDYWIDPAEREHNGVFSAVSISDGGRRLTLTTDALGMGPLYYRSLGSGVAFSTNPRYLVCARDHPDLAAWRCLIQSMWIAGDRSLTAEVRRVPAGSSLQWSRDGHGRSQWFGFDRLPEGGRTPGPEALGDVEAAFQQAIDRCLRLGIGGSVLPLSSGFDSRRVLAALLSRKHDFQAITSRVLQKGGRDLDARFASEMARHFGVPHRIVEAATLEEYVEDHRTRRLLVDAETPEHSWVPRLMSALPAGLGVLFDGIGGDVLGDPVGWSANAGLEIRERSPEQELQEITSRAISRVFDAPLNARRWPSSHDVRDDLKQYLEPLLPRGNVGEISFLLLRQRRAIALWSQQLHPPGYVVVCPYLDLDYLRLLLSYRSLDKHAVKFQRACLREFWPDFYRYPGNRDVPPDLPAAPPSFEQARAPAGIAAMRGEIESHDGMSLLWDLLGAKARFALGLSGWSEAAAVRAGWYLNPLMELVSRQVGSSPCWELS
jgi:hypothetical protein